VHLMRQDEWELQDVMHSLVQEQDQLACRSFGAQHDPLLCELTACKTPAPT
jgi:hypothetical protein